MNRAECAGHGALRHALLLSVLRPALRLLWLLLSLLLSLILIRPVLAAPAPAQLQDRVQDRVVDVSQIEPTALSLTEYVSVLEDASGKLTLDQVQQPAQAARFQGGAPAGYGLNYGLTRSALWVRLTLRNDSTQPLERMVELRYALLSRIQFHQPLTTGGWQTLGTGNVMPFATRPYPNRFFIFPVRLAAHEKQVLYWRIESVNPMNINAFLSTPRQFHRWERNDYLAQGWYFGMVIAMFLFNLVLFIALRELIYGLYLNFALCAALTVAVQNGLANEYLWPNWQQGGDTSFLIMGSLVTATILTFMRAMLNTRISFPRIDGWLKWSVRLFCISLIWIVVSPREAVLLMPVMYLLALFVMFGVSLYCLRKKQRSAALFLLAFSMLMVGAVMAILTGLGWAPVSHFNSNAMQIGSAMEMLLLAFALADRLNSLLREKAHAQQQALVAQQLLLENLHTSEQVLEQRVAERTSELSQSNAALAKTNSELDAMYQRIEASRQQAQDAQAQATAAQAALLMAKDQMIHADKMASLGQLISSVGEEINQALASIQSSGKQMAKALYHSLSGMPPLLRQLDRTTMTHFLRLIEIANTSITTPTTTPGPSETDVESQTRLLLLQHPAAEAMLKLVQSIALVKENSTHIKAAVQRVGKTVRALKSFSHVSPNGVLIKRHLVEDMETVLVIYQNLIEGKNRLVCQFDKIDALYYQPEKLNQVWIGLIQNALQAMQQPGTLSISIRRVGNEAVVGIGDTGCGIAEDILVNIFEPLLITRQAGSGAGIGLDIVKHIIDQHHGRIEIQSQPGVGTTVSVFLPYEA